MKMKFEVNKPLVPMKAHYFLWNAGTGPVVPFLTVYARQLGFSSYIVGTIYTILPIFGMIAKPLFGALSDRFHCQKCFFLIAQLVTAGAFLAIFYSPKVPNTSAVNLSCTNNSAVLSSLHGTTVNLTLLDSIRSRDALVNCKLSCQISEDDASVLCQNWNLSEYCDTSSLRLGSGATFTSLVDLGIFGNTSQVNSGNTSTNDLLHVKAVNLTSCSTSRIQRPCNIRCDNQNVDNLFLRNEIDDSDAFSTYQFWVFLLLMITAWIGQAVAVSLGDAICFEMLGDKPNRYGYQRMYGALGWGLLSLLTGILVDVISKGKDTEDYSIAFYLAAGFLVLDFIVSSRLKYSQTKLSTNILKDVGKLLMNVKILVFLAWCISVGMCTGLMWQFLLWLVEDLAKAQGETRIKTLQGIIMGVQCLGGELPFFFLSGKILKKIGHISAMSLVLFAIGVRFVLYSVITNPWYFIPIEFSNGLTFGLFYACMASYASIVAPAGTEATMQGMVGAVFEGVGVSLGSYMAGLALTHISGSLTFRYFGIGTLLACVIHIIVQALLKTKDPAPQVVVDRKLSVFEKVKLDDQRELTSVDPLIGR